MLESNGYPISFTVPEAILTSTATFPLATVAVLVGLKGTVAYVICHGINTQISFLFFDSYLDPLPIAFRFHYPL